MEAYQSFQVDQPGKRVRFSKSSFLKDPWFSKLKWQIFQKGVFETVLQISYHLVSKVLSESILGEHYRHNEDRIRARCAGVPSEVSMWCVLTGNIYNLNNFPSLIVAGRRHLKFPVTELYCDTWQLAVESQFRLENPLKEQGATFGNYGSKRRSYSRGSDRQSVKKKVIVTTKKVTLKYGIRNYRCKVACALITENVCLDWLLVFIKGHCPLEISQTFKDFFWFVLTQVCRIWKSAKTMEQTLQKRCQPRKTMK